MKKTLFIACAFILMISSSAIASEKILEQTAILNSGTNLISLDSNSISAKSSLPQVAVASDLPKLIDNLVGTFDNETKIFFSDIDGTLIPLDKSVPKGTIQQSVIDGAKELQNAKIPLFLITGRSSREAGIIAQKIGIKSQFVIGQQGAEIVNQNGVLIHEDGIPAGVAKKIIFEVNSFNKKNKLSIIPFIYVKGTMYMFQDIELPYILDKPVIINDMSDIGKDFTAIKVGLYCNDTFRLRDFKQYLLKRYPEYNIVVSADCYCDVSSKTATKGNAIRILSEMLGVELKNVATIGDAENDISMLKLLKDNGGLAIAVDNANEQTKEYANYISTSASNGGFLKAVKNVVKNNDFLKTQKNYSKP